MLRIAIAEILGLTVIVGAIFLATRDVRYIGKRRATKQQDALMKLIDNHEVSMWALPVIAPQDEQLVETGAGR